MFLLHTFLTIRETINIPFTAMVKSRVYLICRKTPHTDKLGFEPRTFFLQKPLHHCINLPQICVHVANTINSGNCNGDRTYEASSWQTEPQICWTLVITQLWSYRNICIKMCFSEVLFHTFKGAAWGGGGLLWKGLEEVLRREMNDHTEKQRFCQISGNATRWNETRRQKPQQYEFNLPFDRAVLFPCSVNTTFVYDIVPFTLLQIHICIYSGLRS